MSASLVGSEMCIRDRQYNVSKPVETCREALQGRLHSSEFGIRYGIPVSYTHLTLPTICSV
eukprot:630232-Alexandrium_andersonii.AAC.1